MPEGYRSDNFESIDDALDELLCEYVDGTMDPTVREAFEEYLEANPDLAYHVECLCRTRQKLCDYGCRHTREAMHLEIRRRVAGELRRKNRSVAVISSRLGNAAMITSAVSLLLILGMMVGVNAVNQMTVDGAEVAIDDLEDPAQFEISSDAHAAFGGALPLEWSLTAPRTPVRFTPNYSLSARFSGGAMTPFTWPGLTGDSLRAGIGGLLSVSAP